MSLTHNFTFTMLQDTRLGRFINVARRKTEDRYLAKRMKHLVKQWQQLVHNFQNGVSVEQTPPTCTSLAPSPAPSLPPRSSVSPLPTVKKDSKLSRREQLFSKFSAISRATSAHKPSNVSNGSPLEPLIVSIPLGKLIASHATKPGHIPMATVASHMTKPIGAMSGHMTDPIANVIGHMTEPIVAMTGNMSKPIVTIASRVTKPVHHMTDIGGSLVVSVPLQKLHVHTERSPPSKDAPTSDTPTIDYSPPTVRVNDVPICDRGEYTPILINKPNGHLATPPNNVSTCMRLYGDTPLPIGTCKATPTAHSPSPKKLHKLVVSIDRVYYNGALPQESPTPPLHHQVPDIKEEDLEEIKLEPYVDEDESVADTCRSLTSGVLPYKLKPPLCQPGIDGCIGCDGNWYSWPDYMPGVDDNVTVLPYVYIDDWDIDN